MFSLVDGGLNDDFDLVSLKHCSHNPSFIPSRSPTQTDCNHAGTSSSVAVGMLPLPRQQ
jgi:hypothetical protein